MTSDTLYEKTTRQPPPPVSLSPGQQTAGFKVVRVDHVPEVCANAYLLRHLQTGAHVMHLHCNDTEKAQVISFSTPPPDDTSVAHIIEHMVF